MGKKKQALRSYDVTIRYTLRETLTVEATDEEDAKEKAWSETKWSGSAESVDHDFVNVRESKETW